MSNPENQNGLQLNIRPLEVRNLWAIQHISSFVNFDYKILEGRKAKLIIELEVEEGVEGTPDTKAKGLVNKVTNVLTSAPPEVKNETLIYNENKLRYNPNGASELTLKFTIAEGKLGKLLPVTPAEQVSVTATINKKEGDNKPTAPDPKTPGERPDDEIIKSPGEQTSIEIYL